MNEIEYIEKYSMNRIEHRIVSENLSFSIRRLKDTIDDLSNIQLVFPVDYDIKTLKVVLSNLQEKYDKFNREDITYD